MRPLSDWATAALVAPIAICAAGDAELGARVESKIPTPAAKASAIRFVLVISLSLSLPFLVLVSRYGEALSICGLSADMAPALRLLPLG
jgi:hypothetical protein